jgi:DNA/RNA-binding domain of Phe-tRNA-synthetase-like protein
VSSHVAVGVRAHPLLDVRVFRARFPSALADLPPASFADQLRLDTPAPFSPDASVKEAVRALLRAGGFKPSGRSKPASEYLIGAAEKGALSPINPAVDACNVASLHSGLPISVVDVDRVRGSLRVDLAPEGAEYVFNASGQVIDIGGLWSIFDDDGPCAGPVKDSQRTKTHPGTTDTISVVWGTSALPGRAEAVTRWYEALLASVGAETARIGA